MEPDILAYLKRIGFSIFVTATWLSITTIAAIAGDNAYIGEQVTTANILFYLWVVVSIVLVAYLLKKIWKK